MGVWKDTVYSPGYAAFNFNRVTFNKNTASNNGGAIGMKDYGGATLKLNMTNVTIASNEAAYGGAIYTAANQDSQVNSTMTNVTFSDNLAHLYGGTIYNSLSSNQTVPTVALTMSLKNTILWDSKAEGTYSSCVNGGDIYNQYGYGSPVPYIKVDYSVIERGDAAICNTNGPTSNAVSIGTSNRTDDPALGPLGDYGGSTKTIVPGLGGSAIDNGTSVGAPSVDQRMVSRPQNGRVDIGAVEQAYITDVIFENGFE